MFQQRLGDFDLRVIVAADEEAGGGFVEEADDFAVELQGGGGDLGRDGAFHRVADGGGFVRAEGQEQAAAGFQNSANPHRDRQPRHFVLAAEVAGVVADGFAGQRLQSRAAAEGRAGFVEGDMPVAADAEDLQINPAGILDLLLVEPAVGLEIERPAVGDMRAAGVDIDA